MDHLVKGYENLKPEERGRRVIQSSRRPWHEWLRYSCIHRVTLWCRSVWKAIWSRVHGRSSWCTLLKWIAGVLLGCKWRRTLWTQTFTRSSGRLRNNNRQLGRTRRMRLRSFDTLTRSVGLGWYSRVRWAIIFKFKLFDGSRGLWWRYRS